MVEERWEVNMLKYEIVENTQEHVTYKYFPEGKDDSGLISVRKKDLEIIKQEIAPNDDFRWCFLKLFKRIKEFVKDDNFDKNGIIAWY